MLCKPPILKINAAIPLISCRFSKKSRRSHTARCIAMNRQEFLNVCTWPRNCVQGGDKGRWGDPLHIVLIGSRQPSFRSRMDETKSVEGASLALRDAAAGGDSSACRRNICLAGTTHNRQFQPNQPAHRVGAHPDRTQASVIEPISRSSARIDVNTFSDVRGN